MTESKNGTAWHAAEPGVALERLASGPDGLTEAEADRRLDEEGPNSLEAEEGIRPAALLVRQLKSPLILLLFGAAALSLAVGHAVDAAVIAAVIMLNTVLGFVQEWRAEGALAALRRLSSPHAAVVRDGREIEIDAAAVVPGDIAILDMGDRVPADARLLEVRDLQVDESSLTGESEPVVKSAEAVAEDAPVADRTGMVWMSTSITGGYGRAVVTATGMRTEIGRIAGEVRASRREQTPLQKRMSRLSALLGLAGVALSTAVFGLGLLRGHGTVDMLLFAVAVAVSAIPEGLPAVISVTLALGVQRMAARNAIVRRLPAVETLGSTTVICSDKTGTITRNQMTVRRVWADGRLYEVTGEGYDPAGEIRPDEGERAAAPPGAIRRLARAGVLANGSRLTEENGRWAVEGNPSDGAVLVFAIKAGFEIDKVCAAFPVRDERPFSSDLKYMAVLSDRDDGGGRTVAVKGAPEKVVDFCTHALMGGDRVRLDDDLRRRIAAMNDRLASEALRVIAGAFRDFETEAPEALTDDIVEQGLTFAGFWGMIDPAREESAPAMARARDAGIRVIMMTGDHASTAAAIARQVGIDSRGEVLTGAEVGDLPGAELAARALEARVVARVSPAHKLKILEALKAEGEIVAMTGDGVNDAPALKGADIGIAMGRAGTEVAKEAADMVLTDDNFATIIRAVEEGRIIYGNLRRVIFFLLATNLGEILTLAGALVIGLELPLTAVMILWVNLVTDGACTIPLGVEPGHRDVLKRPPRDPRAPIVDGSILGRMAVLTPLMAAGTLIMFRWALGGSTFARAQTVAFTTMAAFQWWQAFNARSHRESIFRIGWAGNRWLLLGVAAAVLLQLAAVQTGFGNAIFGTVPLAAADWGLILLVSSSILWADEIRKRIAAHRRRPHGRPD